MLKNGSVLYLRIASPDERVTEVDVRKLPSWLVNYRLEDYARSAQVPIGGSRCEELAVDAPAGGAGATLVTRNGLTLGSASRPVS